MKVASLEFDLLANVARLQQDMNRAQGVMNRSLGAIEQRVERTMASIRRAQMMLGSAFALMGAGFSLSKTTQSITSFEDAMLRLQATSRASASEMAQMEEQARKLGATTRYSAGQAAEAQNFLAMAGFNTSEVLSATADVIQFASAASIDLGRSADIASNVLGQMRLPVTSLSKVMDTLINTTQSSNTNVDQLAEALGYVGPVASAAGINIDELSAAIGVLGDAGIQGSRAGTGLQGVIQRLINVTPAAESALASYGLTVSDVDITTHGLTVVLERLNEANLSAGDSMAIFGQVSAASALNLSAASERVKELTEANVEAAKATGDVSSLLDSGLSAALASVSSAIEEAMLQTGEKGLTGTLKVLAVTTAGVISDFNGLLPEFAESSGISQEFARNIEVLSNALKTLGAVAIATFGGRLIAALTTSSAAFIKANIEAMRYQATLARMAGVSRTAAAGISVMSGVARGALAVFGGPVGLIASVGLAALAFTDFGKSSKDVSADLSALKGPLDEVIEKFSSLESAAQGALMAGLAVEIRESEKKLRDAAATAAEAINDEFSKASFSLGLQASDFGASANEIAAALTRAAKGMEVDWNSLSGSIQSNAEISDGAKETMLALVGQMAESANTLIDLEDKYYALAEAIDLANQVTNEGARAQAQADLAKQLAAKNTQEYIDKLDAETKKMEDSIKTVRQLANEYILLHGLQGGNVEAIMEAVKRNEAAAKAVESHRSSLSRLGGTARTVESEAEKAAKAAKRRAEEFERARKSAYQAQINHISSIHEEAQALEDQVRVFGQGKFALEQLAIARLQEQRTMLSGFKGSEEQIELIEREIDAIERRMAAGTQLEELQEEARVRQEMTDEHIRMNEEIGRTLTDALMRGFEDGKGFAKNMRDTVINMFKTMVLRPIIEPVMQGVAGAITGALGVGGGSGGVMGSLGGVGSLFTNFGGSMAGVMQNLGGSIASLGGPLGDLGANLIMHSDTIGSALDFAGTALSYGNSILNLTKGNYGAAAGGAIGTYFGGPVGSFIGSTLGGMLDGAFKGETRSGGRWTYDKSSGQSQFYEGPSGGYGGQATTDAMTQVMGTAVNMIDSVFEAVGVQAEVAAYKAMFESSGKGRGGTFSGGTLLIDGQEVSFGTDRKGAGYGSRSASAEQSFEDMTKDMAFSALEAWQLAADQMPSIISDMLSGVDVRALSAEQADALAVQISGTVQQVSAFSQALTTLPFENLRALTFDLSATMLQAFGGIENAMAGLDTYYQNFYSETERAGHVIDSLTSAFSELGYELPSSREAYRDLVESIDVTTESGAQLYAQMIQMSGAFASVTEESERAVESMDEVIYNLNAFYSEFELFSLGARDLAGEFQAMQVQLPANRQGFREMLDSIDTTTGAGQEMFNALAATADRANDYYRYVEREAASSLKELEQQVNTSRKAEMDALKADQDGRMDALRQQQKAEQRLLRDTQNAQSKALRDAQASQSKMLSDAQAKRIKALRKAQDERQQAVRDSYAAQRDAISGSISAVNDKLRELESLSSKIAGGLEALRGGSKLATDLHREASKRIVEDATALARAGKSLVGFERLEDAVNAVSQLDTADFASLFDFELERAETVNELKTLGELTDVQVDVQDLQLEALERQLEQLDEWRDTQLLRLSELSEREQEQMQKLFELEREDLKAKHEEQQNRLQHMHEVEQERAKERHEYQQAHMREVFAKEQEALDKRFDVILEQEKLSLATQVEEMLLLQANQMAASDLAHNDAMAAYSKMDSIENAIGAAASRIASSVSSAVSAAASAARAAAAAASAKKSIPGFATGGRYPGGLAVFGEEGPEIVNFDRPAQVYTNAQSKNLVGGDGKESAGLLRQLLGEIKEMRHETRQVVVNTQKILGLVDDAIENSLSDDSIIVTY